MNAGNIIDNARIFATAAHAAIGHTRKYTGEPYINHPRTVAHLVTHVCRGDMRMVAAAWLHDVVEDTQVPITAINDEFGTYVGGLVGWLTDVSTKADGNRARRRAIDRAHSAQAPAAAQTIKVADLIDNTRNIVQFDADFARVYIPEKRLLLNVLTQADPALLDIAWVQIQDAELRLAGVA